MPMDRSKYPDNWEQISERIRFVRAKSCCEGGTWYPKCRAKNHMPHPKTGSKVILTVAHMDHDTTNNAESNLRALCQRCHLAEDREFHAQNRIKNKLAKKESAGQLKLLEV